MVVDTLRVIGSAWRWNLPGLLCCAGLFCIYGALTRFRISRTFLWFIAGEVFLAIVMCSPLDVLARRYLLTAEAIEQMSIGFVASYMFVLGAPERVRISAPGWLMWPLGMGALTMWLLPRLLNIALVSEGPRALEYLALLAGGVVFWWPLHSPARDLRLPLVPQSLLYLAAATVWCSLVGLLVAFGRLHSYPLYPNSGDPLHIASSLASDWSFSREADRETAGLLFWICASTILLTEVMFVYGRWYTSERFAPIPTLRP